MIPSKELSKTLIKQKNTKYNGQTVADKNEPIIETESEGKNMNPERGENNYY